LTEPKTVDLEEHVRVRELISNKLSENAERIKEMLRSMAIEVEIEGLERKDFIVGKISKRTISSTEEKAKYQTIAEIDPSILLLANDELLKDLLLMPGMFYLVGDLRSGRRVFLCRSAGAYRASFDVSTYGGKRPGIPSTTLSEDNYPTNITTTDIIINPFISIEGAYPEEFKTGSSLVPLEPQSPISIPKMELLEDLLFKTKEGFVLGALTIGDMPLIYGDKVCRISLSLDAIRRHVLIVGTTGSGKTTLLKNFLHSVYRKDPLIICLDWNKDFPYLLFRPNWRNPDPYEEKLFKLIYGQSWTEIEGKDIAILIPVAKQEFDEALENAKKIVSDVGVEEQDIIEKEATWTIVSKYVTEELERIADELGCSITIENIPPEDIDERKEWYDKYFLKKELDRGKTILGYIIELKVKYEDQKEESRKVLIAIFAPSTHNMERYKYMDASLTETARFQLPTLLKWLKEEMGIKIRDVHNFIEIIQQIRSARRQSQRQSQIPPEVIDSKTLEGILRRCNEISRRGFIDVNKLDVPTPDDIAEILDDKRDEIDTNIVIVDLQRVGDEDTINFVINSILWIFAERVQKPRPLKKRTIVIIDEAHRVLPTGSYRKAEEYIKSVSSLIERLARIGRQKGLGLIFSTQSANDVNDIVINLTNTKIALKLLNTESELKKLAIPLRYKDLLGGGAPDRICVIMNSDIRTEDYCATFKTPLPTCGHREL